MQRAGSSSKLPIGSALPNFSLPNVDGNRIDSSYFANATASLVVFSCNHCPYVKGSEDRLVRIVRDFEQRGLKAVAISSNDADQYPEDSFEKMKEKAAAVRLPYPYLYDASQEVARAFDAACTPECYLFDASGKLVYHGPINDSPKDSSRVTVEQLRTAVEQLLSGTPPSPEYVHPLGCSIKWSPRLRDVE